jgi:hypothetical protein
MEALVLHNHQELAVAAYRTGSLSTQRSTALIPVGLGTHLVVYSLAAPDTALVRLGLAFPV